MNLGHDDLIGQATDFAARHPQAVGFALTPAAFQLFRAADVDAVPPDWYLLRMFDEQTDLTLERVPGGTTRRHELSEAQAAARGWTRLSDQPYERLIWGKVDRVEDGWAILQDAQTATLDVPFTSGRPVPKDRLALTAVEYVAIDKHGNAAVVAERLTGITVAKGA